MHVCSCRMVFLSHCSAPSVAMELEGGEKRGREVIWEAVTVV